jgi:hypothetical protein
VIPSHSRCRWEDYELEANLSYTVIPCVQKPKIKRKQKNYGRSIEERATEPCVSQLSITVTRFLRESPQKEERFILAYFLRGVSSWLLGPVPFRPVQRWDIPAGCMVE